MGAYHDGPRRPAADFVASGEARMLAWSPPPGAQYVEPHADAQSLVRFLGGLSTAKAGDEPSVGDVVYRVANGSLAMRWPLVFSRLDPFVRNGIQPIIVLDNVPWAFAASNESRSVGYGNNMGPQNVTEYKEFLQVLLQGMVTRYGLHVAQTFWFRVGTEPDTQPKHWNDTNDKFVEMYVAVATVVAAVIPGAKVGPANFAADGPTRAESWASVVVPIVEGINASGARIDYLAISSYGRATMCDEWKEWKGGEERGGRTASTPMGGGLGLDLPPLQRRVDPKCAYSMAEMAETAERLTSLLPLLSPDARGLPLQAYVGMLHADADTDAHAHAHTHAHAICTLRPLAAGHGVRRPTKQARPRRLAARSVGRGVDARVEHPARAQRHRARLPLGLRRQELRQRAHHLREAAVALWALWR